MASQVRNHYSQKNHEAHLEWALAFVSRREPIFIADQMFEHSTQPSSMVLDIANVWAKILVKQDDDDPDQEISDDVSEDPVESTLSSDIKQNDLAKQQEVFHQDPAHCAKTFQMTKIPLPKKLSHADTVIVHTSLPNQRHPDGVIAPPLLQRKTQLLTYYVNLTLYPPRRSRFPKLVETRVFFNWSLVEITMFLNITRLLLR